MRGLVFERLPVLTKCALALLFMLSGCLSNDANCFSEFRVIETEAIRQVEWMTVRLMEQHPDGVAPPGLEDALGMRLPTVMPAGGTLVPAGEAPVNSFVLALPSGRKVGLYFNNRPSADFNAMTLSLQFAESPLRNWCSWGSREAAWSCLRRY